MKLYLMICGILFFFSSNANEINSTWILSDTILYPEETHFRNLQQLTFGADNAEAYWSYDGKYIVFQRTAPKDGVPCDQIFIGKVPSQGEKFTYKMISSGKG